MSKFNRKFSRACARLSFWDTLTRHLAIFENFLKSQDILTHEDKITLGKIHALLYQGYQDAKERKAFHLNKMNSLKIGEKFK